MLVLGVAIGLDHTMLNPPDLVRSRQLSNIGRS